MYDISHKFSEVNRKASAILDIFLSDVLKGSFALQEDASGLDELKLGGAIYVLGVIFFKLDGRIPLAHAIWHLFVVLAAFIHYYAVLTYLILPPASESGTSATGAVGGIEGRAPETCDASLPECSSL